MKTITSDSNTNPQEVKLKDKLLQFLQTKRFAVRGASFAKKMWRDGYNKALDDIYNQFLLDNEDKQSKLGEKTE